MEDETTKTELPDALKYRLALEEIERVKEARKTYQREYMRRYRAKKKAEKEAAHG